MAGVREEAWGLGAGPLARQNAALGYLHDPGAGKPVELWVRVEFQPWWKGFSDLPDEDGEGIPRSTAGPRTAPWAPKRWRWSR